jgi:hypothetical protein
MELVKESFLRQCADHPRFKENDIDEYWKSVAVDYAKSYEGDFPFMLSMKDKTNFTPKMLAAILNCAKKEGESLPSEDEFSFNTETPDEPAGTVEVESHISSAQMAGLSEIEARMKILEANINSLEQKIAPIKAEYDENVSTEKKLLEEIEIKIRQLREFRSQMIMEMDSTKQEIKNAQNELENQRRLHALKLQEIAANQKFEEIRVKFEELAAQFPWNDVIHNYQRDDIYFMAAAYEAGRKGVLNANPMGAGKTFESAAFESMSFLCLKQSTIGILVVFGLQRSLFVTRHSKKFITGIPTV